MTQTMNISDKIAQAVNGAAVIPSCGYCKKQLTAEEFANHQEVGETDYMCDACAEGRTAALLAELDKLKAENAALRTPEAPKPAPANDLAAKVAALQAENKAIQDKAAAKIARKAAEVPAPPNPFAGKYPENATPQDRVLLDALVALRPKTTDPKYPVPAVVGKALYAYLHEALRGKYPPTKSLDTTGKTKWIWTLADAKIRPAVDSAIARGIITRLFGKETALFFDAREVKSRIMSDTRTPSSAVKSAIEAAF
jgi:hypothetical protein